MTIIFTTETLIASNLISLSIGAGLGLYLGMGVHRFFGRLKKSTTKQEK